jgi:hypothetical protein
VWGIEFGDGGASVGGASKSVGGASTSTRNLTSSASAHIRDRRVMLQNSSLERIVALEALSALGGGVVLGPALDGSNSGGEETGEDGGGFHGEVLFREVACGWVESNQGECGGEKAGQAGRCLYVEGTAERLQEVASLVPVRLGCGGMS